MEFSRYRARQIPWWWKPCASSKQPLCPPKRFRHCFHDSFFRRKSAARLLGHLRTVDPDRELPSGTGFELDLELERLLDERRHTGSARLVVSHYAVTDLDAH